MAGSQTGAGSHRARTCWRAAVRYGRGGDSYFGLPTLMSVLCRPLNPWPPFWVCLKPHDPSRGACHSPCFTHPLAPTPP